MVLQYAYAWTSSQAVPAKLLRREKFPTAARLQRRNGRGKPIGGRRYASWANEKPVFGDPRCSSSAASDIFLEGPKDAYCFRRPYLESPVSEVAGIALYPIPCHSVVQPCPTHLGVFPQILINRAENPGSSLSRLSRFGQQDSTQEIACAEIMATSASGKKARPSSGKLANTGSRPFRGEESFCQS
ncbi:hypothetical protein EYR41_005566 [Orbilia oligospora]|uniref:Uncharacterized protein n=1 Tax=Orbilia oligospora TaxID=2813651 RepID=A0A8H2DYW1_ORBOL|nr:hypothetical protein EYR41_005566 [Orbilia oligospora]